MKIINTKDVNNLILYSKRNLGIYRLVYKEYKKYYWTIVIFTLVSIILLVLYIISSITKFFLLEKICFISCLVIASFTLYLIYLLNEKTKMKHLEIQKNRIKKLKEYYIKENFTIDDIKIVNEQLNKRIEKTEKQKTTCFIMFGILILPIWESFIQYFCNDYNLLQFAKLISFSFLFSIVVAVFIKIGNAGMNLYEETFYIFHNIYIMENLIYLNNYIIKWKEGKKKYG